MFFVNHSEEHQFRDETNLAVPLNQNYKFCNFSFIVALVTNFCSTNGAFLKSECEEQLLFVAQVELIRCFQSAFS